MTSFNGQAITYDTIGNPLTYRDGLSFGWQGGRNLSYVLKNDASYAVYGYNTDGQRTSKSYNNTSTYYNYLGSTLHSQEMSNGKTMSFYYDESGNAYGFNYDGLDYFYILNIQGDVVGILDDVGSLVARYTYDSWGKILSITGQNGENLAMFDSNGDIIADKANHIANINPLRYRSYYYDNETGLYYLNSRYYDPETGRFLNADSVTDGGAGILGNNLFIYAANNPVNNSDPSGHWIIKNAFKKAVKCVAKNIAKPIANTAKKILPKLIKGTVQAGGTVTGAFGVSGTASAGIAYDGQGNIGVTKTVGGGGGSPSASACLYGTRTTAPTINKLEGISAQIGGSADVLGANVGVEMTAFSDSTSNQAYFGGTVMAGIGVPIPVELHGDVTYTKVFYINIFEEFDKIYDKIMKW